MAGVNVFFLFRLSLRNLVIGVTSWNLERPVKILEIRYGTGTRQPSHNWISR